MCLAVAVVLALVWGLGKAGGVSFGRLSRDPLGVAGLPPYVGLLSNLGVLAWCVAAAVAGFAAVLLRQRGSRREARFFGWTAVLTAALLLDDLLMGHEAARQAGAWGSEWWVLGPLGVLAAGYVLAYRRRLLEGPAALLVVAALALGFSLFADQLLPARGRTVVFEDGAKLLGVVAWCVYVVVSAAEALQAVGGGGEATDS